MKSCKFIVLLFGIGCSDLNLSNSLSYKQNILDFRCDFNGINYYENNYCENNYCENNYCENNFSVIKYENKEQKKILNVVSNVFNILYVFFIVCASFVCSIVVVSNYVYSSMVNQFVTNYNSNKIMYEYDSYLFEYLDEFNNMKTCVLSVDYLNSLKYKFLKHNTPKGEIIMNYNHLYSCFDYYCKKSNIIEFSYLDVVSRIYVVKNNCKNIYIDKCENCDYSLVNDAALEPVEEADVLEEADVIEEADVLEDVNNKNECSIFYNKLNNNIKPNESNDYVSNKYKYKGTIEEFYSYCESNKYKIHYNDLLEASDTNYSITFSIDKDEDNCAFTNNKNNIGFKEFKKFQKF